MYTSYVISCALLTTFYFVAVALFPGGDSILLAAVAMIPFLPLLPAVFRYSRVTWIYFERAGCPTAISAGSYEKLRSHQAGRPES
jgi:hypothetical protein